jgi:hypothetical protein
MTTFSDQMMEWTRAYRLLGVEHEATARAIKDAYRKMVKRWHPDLYPAGSLEHAEATQMTASINSAYKAIAQAPLRYRRDAPAHNSMPTAAAAYSVFLKSRADLEKPDRPDKIEFWVRFVCGSLFGALMGVWGVLIHWQSTTGGRPALIIVAVVVLFGFGAARFGDRFWYAMLQSHRWDFF